MSNKVLVEKCNVCGKSGYRNYNARRRSSSMSPIYCSKECQGLAHRTVKRSGECRFCGKVFDYGTDSYGSTKPKIFCSKTCKKGQSESLLIKRLAGVCKKCGVELPARTVSGKIINKRTHEFCRSCFDIIQRDKAVLKRAEGGYKTKQNDGYVMVPKSCLTISELEMANLMVKSDSLPEHRLAMAMHIGRPLEKKEVVHHLNGKKDDNSIENLELVKWSIHNKSHKDVNRELLVLRKRIRELETLLIKSGVSFQPVLFSPEVA